MPTNFLDLPSEIRNDIYERLLVLEDPILCLNSAWIGDVYPGTLSWGLLLANKKVLHEASSIFYAQNCFDLTGQNPEQMDSFFSRLGQSNAESMRHVIIDFPRFHCLDLQRVALDAESSRILEIIKSRCSNLSTVTTSACSTHTMELDLDALECPKVVVEALALVNSHFRSIPSLQEVVVEVYEVGASDYIRKEMIKFGWKVNTTGRLEDSHSDRFFGDWDDDYSFDDASYGEDEYDIDNDSDFWRRAGD